MKKFDAELSQSKQDKIKLQAEKRSKNEITQKFEQLQKDYKDQQETISSKNDAIKLRAEKE